ncbi:MAG: glycosyl hydrolase 108 family protein, partial [Saprospiraceae bacterium]
MEGRNVNSLYGEKFDKAIERCLGHEGGYSNDPDDPGGETQWGISKRSYPSLNIKDLTREQAIALYHRDFWNKIGGESFPTSIGFQLMDFAINSGPSTALRALQRAVGVADDGHIGPFTLAAIKKMELHDLAMLFVAERMMFMT